MLISCHYVKVSKPLKKIAMLFLQLMSPCRLIKRYIDFKIRLKVIFPYLLFLKK